MRFSSTIIKVRTWMSNHMLHFYDDVLTIIFLGHGNTTGMNSTIMKMTTTPPPPHKIMLRMRFYESKFPPVSLCLMLSILCSIRWPYNAMVYCDPGMHHGTCVTQVPWCMSGSLISGDGKTFPAFPADAQPAILRIGQEAHTEKH